MNNRTISLQCFNFQNTAGIESSKTEKNYEQKQNFRCFLKTNLFLWNLNAMARNRIKMKPGWHFHYAIVSSCNPQLQNFVYIIKKIYACYLLSHNFLSQETSLNRKCLAGTVKLMCQSTFFAWTNILSWLLCARHAPAFSSHPWYCTSAVYVVRIIVLWKLWGNILSIACHGCPKSWGTQ